MASWMVARAYSAVAGVDSVERSARGDGTAILMKRGREERGNELKTEGRGKSSGEL